MTQFEVINVVSPSFIQIKAHPEYRQYKTQETYKDELTYEWSLDN